MPALERLHAALPSDRFELLAITTDTRKEAITGFARSLGLTFPILVDDQRDVSDALMVRGLPTTVLIDADGRMLARAVGPREWDSPEMLALIRSLIKSI
jgi:peroxiredoxin